MTDTYEEIMTRLLALMEKNPERFLRFYNAVYLMCEQLPEGREFRISERCAEKSRSLFRDIVATLVMEQEWDLTKGLLELSDDQETVRRGFGLREKKKVSPWSPL